MKDSVSITIPSNPKYLSAVRELTLRIGEANGIEKGIIEDIRLAVDEACANVIKHAYKGNTGKKITVKYKITEKVVEVIIDDTGIRVRPSIITGRDLNKIRPGGLGVHLISRAFDVMEYNEHKKHGNRLRLIKHLKTDLRRGKG